MKPGNLVKIHRSSIGVPAGTIGLIMESFRTSNGRAMKHHVHIVKLAGNPYNIKTRRYGPEDLEVISESR